MLWKYIEIINRTHFFTSIANYIQTAQIPQGVPFQIIMVNSKIILHYCLFSMQKIKNTVNELFPLYNSCSVIELSTTQSYTVLPLMYATLQ